MPKPTPAPVNPLDFRPKTIKIVIDDPEAAEHFLHGLIVAQSNNSSDYFPTLIEAVNDILAGHRKRVLEEQMRRRAEAGMP